MTRQISPLHWGETRFYRRLVRDENVLGWGVAEKLRYGVATGDSALTIYVERKVSDHKVPQQDRFPSFVRTSYGRMPIDIVSLGPRQSEGSATVDVAYHARPVPIGVEIGIDGGPPGTLGCLVRDNTDDSLQILSTSSVLAHNGTASSGTPVYQPAPPFLFPGLDHTIATLTRSSQPLSLVPKLYPPRETLAPNNVDAAIAAPVTEGIVNDKIINDAFPTDSRVHPIVGMIIGTHISPNGKSLYIVSRASSVMAALNVRPLRNDAIADPEVGTQAAFAGSSQDPRPTTVLSHESWFKVSYPSPDGPQHGLVTDVFLCSADYGVDADCGAVVYSWAGNKVKSRCSGCAIATDLERAYGIPFTEDVGLADKLRDDYLVKTATGRMLVQLFYKNEHAFRDRLDEVDPTEAEIEYAELLYDKYVELARSKVSDVSWDYVPLTPETMDDLLAAVYGLSRFMTDQEYDAVQDLVDVLRQIEGDDLRHCMDFMDSRGTADDVLTILQSVPDWDTSYDPKGAPQNE